MNAQRTGDISQTDEAVSRILSRFTTQSEFSRCIYPLLQALGWAGHPRQILEALPHYSDSIDLTAFLNAMVFLKYESFSLELPLANVDSRLFPCLYIPNDSPSMVVLARNDAGHLVYDSKKNKQYVLDELSIKGTAYIFRPIDTQKSAIKRGWFHSTFSKFKKIIYQMFFLSFLSNLFVLAIPLYVMTVYDRVIASSSSSMLTSITIGVLLAVFGTYLLQHSRQTIMAYLGGRLDNIIGNVIFERLLYLPPSFTENAAIGGQISRIKDFDTVRDFFTGPLFSLLFELPFTLIYLIIIWLIGGPLVLIPIVMLCVIGAVSAFLEPYVMRTVLNAAAISSKRQNFQLETLSHLNTIKYCSAEKVWFERYKDHSANSATAGYHAALASSTSTAISDGLLTVSSLCVMIFGVMLILSGDVSVGALIAIMMLISRLLSPIKNVFNALTKISQIISSIKQIDLLMHITPERDNEKLIYPLDKLYGQVEFERVSFRYRNNLPPALMNVAAKIAPHELICVIGRNGAGKSTLLKLTARLYTPQAGSILVDGQDVRQLDPIELRHSVAYLPQVPQFFYGTIEQNLRFSSPTATDEELVEATKRAGCYDAIMQFKDQFATRIKENAANHLPVSFKQQMALARIYLKHSGLILLDEPGNGLTIEADEKLIQALDILREKSTIIMVTHRPAHLRRADRVFFLDNGQLMLNGKPDEVLNRIPKDYL